MFESMHEQISKIGIVPVIKLGSPEQAVPLAKALIEGGIPAAEVTFRSDAAAAGIKAITDAGLDIAVGAGTVLTIEQVDAAVASGAKFIVSPGLDPEIVEYCVNKNIPVYPGCANASDVAIAVKYGLTVVKFFPAEQAGGINYIKALAGPYTTLKFMPTGGVNAGNLNNYLAYEKILACGGSWMVPGDLLAAGDYAGITALCKKAVAAMLDIQFAHVGINTPDADSAKATAEAFDALFNTGIAKDGNSSIFAGNGSEMEIMKKNYLGAKGHIGFKTNSIERAMFQMERKGIKFNMDTASYDAKGNIKAIYLQDEIAGFAVHLVRR